MALESEIVVEAVVVVEASMAIVKLEPLSWLVRRKTENNKY